MPRLRPRLGTVLTALCVTEIVSWGLLYYTFPVLAPLITADTGWSSSAVAAAFSAALVVSALAGVPVGRMIDQYGPRWVMTAGSVLGALALVVVATSPTLTLFFVGWLLAGVAMAGVLYPPAFAAITGWFTARRLGALTTLTLVAGLASTVFAPLTAAASDLLGWRETYLWAAVVLAVLTVPIHWFLLRRPWPARAHVDGGEPDAENVYASSVVRTVQFWLLAGGLTVVSLAMYAALLALVPLMLERGLTAQTAAWVLGLGGPGQVAGRLVYTALAHRTSLTVRTATVFGLVTVSTAVLAVVPGPVGLLIAASMTAGVGRGIATLLQATAVTDRWGPRAYGHLSGVLGLPVLLASASAPFVGAVLAELTGSYARAFAVLAVLAAGGTVLMVASTRMSAQRPTEATAPRTA
ncbi:MFS transporter [uncultured Agrococcus sp.]|uniref:MFS transporter n=1 Tax=uncultured Agrococcus sp. TaxID=382258 RepID=UPI0025D6830B|nr:MFS transporter [uncultured Agrococcus sp.]